MATQPSYPSPTLKILAGNIVALRAVNNWSTRGLAEHARVARSTLYQIERLGFETVSLRTVDKIAKGLGVRTGSLFEAEPHKRDSPEVAIERVLAKNLAAARFSRGMTQSGLSDVCGVSMFLVAHIERGARTPDLRTVERLAAGLGTSVADLLHP